MINAMYKNMSKWLLLQSYAETEEEMKRKLSCIFLSLALMITMSAGLTGTACAADQGNRVNYRVSVDGKDYTVKGYNASYTYNTYVSLRDLCASLNGTPKNMSMEKVDAADPADVQWNIMTGKDYAPVGTENKPFESVYKGSYANDDVVLEAAIFNIDGKKRQYRIYYPETDSGEATDDPYMKLVDLGLVFGINVDYTDYDRLTVNTKSNFSVDMEKLEEDEYFHDLDGVYLGNATTGEKLYSWDADHQTEIASTSKLMTFLLVEEAIRDGKISLDTRYSISEHTMEEAKSEDSTGICRNNWKTGNEVTVQDLIAGMLLPSANECATALSEVVAGAYGCKTDLEANFVKMMNRRAKELGLTSAKFINPHGLPQYVKSQTTGKRQNKMSAGDMFRLTSYLIQNYRAQLTSFTTREQIEVPSFGENVYATSTYRTLIWNMGVIGLKTGTTNRSGACIVTAIDIPYKGQTQTVVSVVFGAENNMQRYEASNMLLKYAQQYYEKKALEPSLPEISVEQKEVQKTGIRLAAAAKKKAVRLTWKKKGSAKLAGYYVYKATKKNGKYKKVATTKKTAYTVKKLKSGKKVYYKVRGYKKINGKTIFTKWSNVVKKAAK